jgi:hypothetical protein
MAAGDPFISPAGFSSFRFSRCDGSERCNLRRLCRLMVGTSAVRRDRATHRAYLPSLTSTASDAVCANSAGTSLIGGTSLVAVLGTAPDFPDDSIAGPR